MFFKKVLILIVALVNINWQEMEYKILDWQTANDLKDSMKATFVLQPDFNFSSIYLLKDSSYLIMPLNPFGNSVLTTNKGLLDKWVNEKRFPNIDEANNFYFENQDKIDNLIANKDALKETLCNYIFKEQKKVPSELTKDDIDSIYNILKRRKRIKEYKLNFIILAGDFILTQHKNKNYRWGLLKDKQLLNPIVSLILITDINKNQYFNLEDEIFGKWGYTGMYDILHSILNHKRLPNEMVEIEKIM